MNHRFVRILFHTACVFCLLAVYAQGRFLLYRGNEARALAGKVTQIEVTNAGSSPALQPDPNKGTQILVTIRNQVQNAAFGVLFLPDNSSGAQTTVYAAGNLTAFLSPNLQSGRFFSPEELNGNSAVLVAFADSWLDRYYYREQRPLAGIAGYQEVIGVLAPNDPLQQDGCDMLAPLGFNGDMPGKWYVSGVDSSFISDFTAQLQALRYAVQIAPASPSSWNWNTIGELATDQFFFVFLIAFLTSLVNLILFNLRHLRLERKWNRIRYRVGARKSTHFPFALRSALMPAMWGTLIGILLQTVFWLSIFRSSQAMVRIALGFPVLGAGAIGLLMLLFSMQYGLSGFTDVERKGK